MLVVPLVLFAILVSVLFYLRTQKAGRELELRRIQNDLAAMARLRQNGSESELAIIPAEARRRVGRR